MKHLAIAKEVGDRAREGRAYGNLAIEATKRLQDVRREHATLDSKEAASSRQEAKNCSGQ